MKRSQKTSARHTQDVADLLYRNSFGGLLISLIVSTALVINFSTPITIKHKQAWLGAMVLCLIVRFIDTLNWRFKLLGTDYDGKKTVRRFIFGCVITAIMWATYTVFFFQHMDVIEFTSTAVILAAMAGGASTVLAAHRYTAIAYALILLVPISICGITSEQEHHHILGYLGLAFAMVMTAAAYKSSEFTRQAIHLKNDNADLLVQMEIEKQAVKEANSSLEQKVKLRTQEIYELSYVDPLTGLPNRRAFSEQLADLMSLSKERDETIALLFIDLDGFKGINDSRGHKIGDFILQETAKRIDQLVESHRNICRWGGDEFLIALPNVGHNDALELAQKIINHLALPIEVEGESLSVGATIGIALYPDHGDNEDQLIRVADSAMYMQKKSSKSEALVFSQYMMDILDRRQYLRDGLAQAIAKKQLFLHYQPIVDAANHKVVAFEALLRWRYEDELIPPDEFIPIAEQFGFIKNIGSWVLEQACHDASQWPQNDKLAVSVNVSIIQLMDDDFKSRMEYALSRCGLAANRLSIEVTESVFAEDKRQLHKYLVAIQKLGVKVSIDDFGTGYSSLSQLQTLAVDSVKIDRIFVQKIEDNGEAIIQAALHIAHSLKYHVVAEGIENKEQAQRLEQMGAQYLQGFYFSKPMPQNKVIEWIMGF